MFGSTDLSQLRVVPTVVSAISLVALVTDLARGRIYNWLTLPALAGGLAYSAWAGGWAGLGGALLGAGAGLLFLGWMFPLGFIGGGDVKFLMALGAWGGIRYCAEVALLSILLGGVLAVGILATRGRLVAFARKLQRFLLSLAVRELAVEIPAMDRNLKMPFGVPMAIAAVWAILAHPLASLGMGQWF